CPLRRIWIGDCKLLPRGESTVVVLGLFGGEILEVGEISIDCGSGRVVYFLHFPEKGIDDTGLVGVKSEFTESLGQCPCVLLWQSAAKGFGAPSKWDDGLKSLDFLACAPGPLIAQLFLNWLA